MEPRRRRIDHVSDPSYLDDLASLSMEDLRKRRKTLDDLDTELSFYRRMLHGRMDLLAFEMRRRTGEETRSLIEALPEILSDGADTGGRSPIPQDLPLTIPEHFGKGNRAIDRVLGDGFLTRLPSIDDAELADIAEALEEAEREISSQRRIVFDAHDRINAEIARRYRDGLTGIDDLLTKP